MSDSREDKIKILPHHCGISVPDIEAAITWYENTLGFSVIKRATIEAVPAKIAFLKHGDFHLELFQIENAAPLPEERRHPNLDIYTHGTKHIAFAVPDVPEFIDEMKKRGVDIAMDVNMMEDKAMAFIRDNSGNLIEVVEIGSP